MNKIDLKILQVVKEIEENGISPQAREISDAIDWKDTPNKLSGCLARLAKQGELHYIPRVNTKTQGRWTTKPAGKDQDSMFKQFAAHPMRIGGV